MATSESHLLSTLAVAVLFAAIFLFGGRGGSVSGRIGHRQFLSFAAGVSVAYIFVHVLPALQMIREFDAHAVSDSMIFPEQGVYLWTMAGFLVFFGLETMAHKRQAPEGDDDHGGSRAAPLSWLHMSGFALYTSLLAYMMVWTGKHGLTLGLFAVAMGLHLVTIAGNLSGHYRETYHPRGALLLASASLAGWGAAATLEIPVTWVLKLVAFVIGGVVVNTAIAELPQEKESRYGFFVMGAALYTALLLTLAHLETPA